MTGDYDDYNYNYDWICYEGSKSSKIQSDPDQMPEFNSLVGS